MDFEILKKAGVGQQEFAELVGVSRITVNNWVRGKNDPSRHLAKQVKHNLTLITAAHRLKYLPGDIPTMHKTNVESRREYIRDKLDDAALKIKERQAKRKNARKKPKS